MEIVCHPLISSSAGGSIGRSHPVVGIRCKAWHPESRSGCVFTRLPQVASNQYILVAQPDGHDMICAVSRVGKTNDWNLWYKPKSFLKGLAVMSYN